MKQRGWPIWLLRDVMAFWSVLCSFLSLMIFTITSDGEAMRNAAVREKIRTMLADAEARLNHAFWREAYRRLGWRPRLVAFASVVPPTQDETLVRFKAYVAAFKDMESCVRAYVEHLRVQYRLDASALAAHGSTDARQSRAARHELVGVGTLIAGQLRPSTCHAEAQRRRKDERGSTHARAPPFHQNQKHPTRRPHLRDRTRVPIAPARPT